MVDSGAVATLADAGAAPEVVRLQLGVVGTDGGLEVVELRDGSTFEFESIAELRFSSPTLDGARLRLLDGADRLVPSDEHWESGDGGLMVTIHPLRALPAGVAHELVLDSQVGPPIRTAAGTAIDEVRVRLRARTDNLPAPATKPDGPKRKRKR